MTVDEIFVVYANGTNYTFKCTEINFKNYLRAKNSSNYHSPMGYISRFTPHKFTSTDAINTRVNETGIRDNEKFRIETSDDGKWKVVNNKFVYKTANETYNIHIQDESFGQVIAVNKITRLYLLVVH